MQVKDVMVRSALAAMLLLGIAGVARAESAAATPPTGANADSTKSLVDLRPRAEEGLLVFASPDGQFKWWFDVRVVLDGTFFVEDKNSLGDGVFLRRARFALKTILWRDWYAELDADFASEAVAMKDAYIRYDNLLNRTASVRVGNFKTPFELEELTSSRYLMFPERSLGLDPFLPGRKMGVEFTKASPKYRVAFGAFGPDVTQYETTADDMNFSWIGRVNTNLFRTKNRVLHLGLAGAWENDQLQATSVRFKSREEYDVSNYKFLDTDAIPNVRHYALLDGELAYQCGRLRVQGEKIAVGVARNDPLPGLNFGGGYVCASFFLTHDAYPYEWRAAQFQRVRPTGKIGAIEIAARYSYADLNDLEVKGGQAGAFTVGMNWYPNPNIKMMLDYVMLNNDANANAKGTLVGNDDYRFLQFRFQAAF